MKNIVDLALHKMAEGGRPPILANTDHLHLTETELREVFRREFPVLYFLCAAILLHNLPAAIIMVIFGAAHLTVSIQSFR